MTDVHDELRRWARIDRQADQRERWDRRRRGGRNGASRFAGPPSISTLRIPELERVFADNYRGRLLPDDDSGRHDVFIMANTLARAWDDTDTSVKAIVGWCAVWAPWLRKDDATALAQRAAQKRLKWSADKLGRVLGVTMEQRGRLALRTIGSYEMTKAERMARRQEKKREREEKRRRESGAVSRATYEAGSLSRSKPWVVLGVSRRTWYRLGRPLP